MYELVRVKESLEGCMKEKKQKLEELLQVYRGVFHEPKGLQPKRELEHEIQFLTNSPLQNIGLYILVVLEEDRVNKQLWQLLEQEVIIPSTSPCGYVIIIAPKKDGIWRMCINHRALNKITLKNRYSLPRIDDLLN